MKHRYVAGIKKQLGRSLVEVMVGLTLGLIVLGIASSAYISAAQSTRSTESEAKLNEAAAITLGILQQQVRLAGYSEIYNPQVYSINKNFNQAGLRGCSGGFSGTLTVPYNNIVCSNVDGSTSLPDSLVVRYQANLSNTIPTNNSPTNCVGNRITSATPSDATSTVASAAVPPPYALAENRYYIRTQGTPSGGPELYCLGLRGPNDFSTPYPIMEGVEYMQLTYGVAATPTGTVTTAYMSASDVDTTFAAETNRWQRIVSVRICVIMRSVDGSESYRNVVDSDTRKYYDCNNNQQTSTDGKARRSYTTTVMLKNQLSKL